MATTRSNSLSDRLSRSGYFVAVLCLNLLLFFIVAGRIIFPPYHHPQDDFDKTFVPTTPSAPPPPATPVTSATMPVPTAVKPPSLTTAITTANSASAFNIPMPNINPVAPTPQQNKAVDTLTKASTTAPPSADHLQERLPSILDTVTKKWDRDPHSLLSNPGDVKSVIAKFPICLAYYQNGDPYCNNYTDPQGNIISGALVNLMAEINAWSHGNIKGEVEPKAIDIGTPDLLAKMPPFIYFTGHTDFKLTDTEVKNLQQYLHNGGAIWGDSAFAGTNSRFDVAFRREMKRVIPDIDKNFEPLPMDHKIFTKSWFPMDHIPSGMNYYAEPIQVINLDGKLAVIYTPNDYGDMMTMLLSPGESNVQMLFYYGWGFNAKNDPYFPRNTPQEFHDNAALYYRNYTAPSGLDVDKLGMNIVAHLLVRFDDVLRMVP